ncbi:MAG: hypothetical protein EPN68_04995, partial [Rhodanobacter sp.]
KILGTVHPRWGVPRPAMWVNLAVSFLFLFDADGKVLRSAQGVAADAKLRARLADGELPLRVEPDSD